MTKEKIYSLIEELCKEKHKKMVTRLFYYLHNRHNAEDILQEAYYRALKYWKTFNSEEDFQGRFRIILNNVLKDFMKAERLRGMKDENYPPIREIQNHIFHRLALKEVLDIIDEKTDRVKRILYLHLIDGYTAKEVEQIVPESVATIWKITQRFREEIKDRKK